MEKVKHNKVDPWCGCERCELEVEDAIEESRENN